MPARLDHLTLTVTDLPAALAFYDAALAPLGWGRAVELADEEEDGAPVEAVGYGPGGVATLWVVGGAAVSGPVHLALRVDSRSAVEAFHAAAVAAGGTSHDAPRRWALYRRGEFNAMVADPSGSLVEAVADE